MKKQINGLEFVRVQRDGLDDFKEYIMPHVYEQLFSTPDFEEDRIILNGATIFGIPVGACVVAILPEDEIFIYSIVVADNYQRKGLGTALIESLLQIASDEFDAVWGTDLNSIRAFVHTEYVMPAKKMIQFEAFLKAAGFTEFKEYETAYHFKIKSVAINKADTVDAHSLSSLSESSEDIRNYFLNYGEDPAMDLSFFTGSEDNPNFLMMFFREDDDLYTLSSTKVSDRGTMREYISLFEYCRKIVMEKNPSCRLIVNTNRNLYEEFWQALAKERGTEYRDHEAGLYVLISGGEE